MTPNFSVMLIAGIVFAVPVLLFQLKLNYPQDISNEEQLAFVSNTANQA